jgi:signal transduction histidine kinase
MVRAIDEIVWTLNPRNDSLDQLATYVCQSAEQFFRHTPTRCRFEVADPLPGEMLKSDIRHHLFLLLKEAMQNVAKHAAAAEVWVRIQVRNGHAVFEVEDDGRGFTPETPSTGDGLENMRRRAAAMRATVAVRAAPGHGTRVRVELPLSAPSVQNHPSG